MKKKLLAGFDIGSSSIKVTLIDAENGDLIASAFSPETEMSIDSSQIGWAEQHPDKWWEHLKTACGKAFAQMKSIDYEISAIGISYQMHGLVMVDKNGKPVYPSIIWCDSRAVEIGDKAFNEMGNEFCLENYLNSPGNFTASKLKWIIENKPEIYKNIFKIMLPGDYIAYKLTGDICTTASGLSEGIFWNFKTNSLAAELLEHYNIDKSVIPDILPTFSIQGRVNERSADELGIKAGIPVSYRAGDQPNNAFSLNVLNPGEIAATAGTSGVVYGIVKDNSYDKFSRVNSFAHVNFTEDNPLKGVLLCINGTGILYNWLRNEVMNTHDSYEILNRKAQKVNIGSDGILTLPFGNGAERVLMNKNIGSHIMGLSFNNHSQAHLIRSAQEGIAFSFKYGIDIMKDMGIDLKTMRAGMANMFLSDLFTEAIANTSGAVVELYNTDGAQGAARGAGVGSKIFNNFDEAFAGLKKSKEIEPEKNLTSQYLEIYESWKEKLEMLLRN